MAQPLTGLRVLDLAGGVAGGTADSQNVRRDTGARAPEAQLDADTLQALEQKLTGYVGPIARILVRTTAGRSRSVGDLCSQLALSITDSAERERFRRDVELLLRSRSPVAAGASWPSSPSSHSSQGETLALDMRGYHDHNWGRFRWGDDFGWIWGSVLPRVRLTHGRSCSCA